VESEEQMVRSERGAKRRLAMVAIAGVIAGVGAAGNPASAAPVPQDPPVEDLEAAAAPTVVSVVQINGAGEAAAVPVEPGGAALLRVQYTSANGLALPSQPGSEGVQVCTRPGRVDRDAGFNCVGWFRAGLATDGVVEVLLDIPASTPPGSYSNYDLDLVGPTGERTRLTTGLPAIQVVAALQPSQVDTYRVYEEQLTPTGGVYWVGTNDFGRAFVSPQGTVVDAGNNGQYQGGWVFKRIGAAGAVVQLNQFDDTTPITYVNRLGTACAVGLCWH
jgi:hypothetical protein